MTKFVLNSFPKPTKSWQTMKMNFTQIWNELVRCWNKFSYQMFVCVGVCVFDWHYERMQHTFCKIFLRTQRVVHRYKPMFPSRFIVMEKPYAIKKNALYSLCGHHCGVYVLSSIQSCAINIFIAFWLANRAIHSSWSVFYFGTATHQLVKLFLQNKNASNFDFQCKIKVQVRIESICFACKFVPFHRFESATFWNFAI